MEDFAQATEAGQEEREKRALVKRIAETAAFRNAPRIRDFFPLVCDMALSGRAAEISESKIGTEVFRRAPGYDTASDNIVRVTARQLRAKLLEYFESEGRGEPFRLEVPKGSYVPLFHRLEPMQPLEARDRRSRRPVTNRWRGIAVVLAVCVAALAGLCVGLWRHSAAQSRAAPERRSILDLVVRPDHRTLIVLPDAGIVYMQEFSGHPLSLEEYANRDYSQLLEAHSPELRSVLNSLRGAQLTSVAGLGLISRIFRTRGTLGGNIEIRQARSVTALALREDDVILVGGPRSNPWVQMYEDRLNFRFRFPPGEGIGILRNSNPKPGEPAAYRSGPGKSYARVAVLPNGSASRSILLIAGMDMESSEAAADFAMVPQPQELMSALGVRGLSDSMSFEVLLATSAAAGAGKDAHLIAARLLHR